MTETLGSKIDRLLEINEEILSKLQDKNKKEPYKYQSVIDYLKGQGRITGKEPVIESSECIQTPEEAIKILKDLIENKQKKKKCLTKEDLIEFFKKPERKPVSIELVPPFR